MLALHLAAALSMVVGALSFPHQVQEAREPHDFVLAPQPSLSKRGGNDYSQDWETSGPVTYSSTANNDTYTVSWDYPQVFVVGVGWQTGSYK